MIETVSCRFPCNSTNLGQPDVGQWNGITQHIVAGLTHLDVWMHINVGASRSRLKMGWKVELAVSILHMIKHIKSSNMFLKNIYRPKNVIYVWQITSYCSVHVAMNEHIHLPFIWQFTQNTYRQSEWDPWTWKVRLGNPIPLFSYSSSIVTLWLFNIAMENCPFIDDFPIKTSIYEGFSMAMLNNQMVHQSWMVKPTHCCLPSLNSSIKFCCNKINPLSCNLCNCHSGREWGTMWDRHKTWESCLSQYTTILRQKATVKYHSSFLTSWFTEFQQLIPQV